MPDEGGVLRLPAARGDCTGGTPVAGVGPVTSALDEEAPADGLPRAAAAAGASSSSLSRLTTTMPCGGGAAAFLPLVVVRCRLLLLSAAGDGPSLVRSIGSFDLPAASDQGVVPVDGRADMALALARKSAG